MDNRYFNNGCPALMQDARFITNYYQNRSFEQYIRKANNLESAQDYKNFLQENAVDIMDRERSHMVKNNTCDVNGKCVPVSNQPKHDIGYSAWKGCGGN
jgi:hypothetical protein